MHNVFSQDVDLLAAANPKTAGESWRDIGERE